MSFGLLSIALAGLLFVAMLAVQALGRRLGERELGDGKAEGPGAAEGAVFALLGLVLAFTFTGAGARFDNRRALVVEEVNAIGTAWLRIDLLPADRQPRVRDLFRRYVDARIATYRLVPDMKAAQVEYDRSLTLQQEIWAACVDAARASGQVPPNTVLLPALNTMFDIVTTRTAATRMHPPIAVYLTLVALGLVGALFAGFGLAGKKSRNWIHRVGFAAITALIMLVIVDFEYPRLGFIRMDDFDHLLVDMRASMR